MDVTERVRHLSAAELAPVVRNALRDQSAWPSSWEVESLGWAAVNPGTLGLYRLAGLATTGGGAVVPWAVVLKVVGDADLAGSPLDVGFMHEPPDWNYWRRESEAFTSGLLLDWPGPLVPVRCLGVDDSEPDRSWIWLEACEAAGHGCGDLEQQALLAYDLATFAAQWSDRAVAVAAGRPWLVRRWLRQGLASYRPLGLDHTLGHDGCWRHPLLTAALPTGTRGRVQVLFGQASSLLEVLDRLPTTLAHHDTQASNFFIRDPSDADSRTVAIDWGFVGLAPVGHDLGCHLWSNLATWTVGADRAAVLDRGSTEAYLQGLLDQGWEGDVDAVLFARATAGALATATMLTAQVSELCPESPSYDGARCWPEELAEQHQLGLEDTLDRWALVLEYALGLGEEAGGRRRGILQREGGHRSS